MILFYFNNKRIVNKKYAVYFYIQLYKIIKYVKIYNLTYLIIYNAKNRKKY